MQAIGSRLLRFRASESRVALAALVRDLGAQGVYFNHLYDPISMVRDNEVKAALSTMGVACQSFTADVLREPWQVLDGDKKPFTCFDDFWVAHCAAPAPPAAPFPPPSSLPPIAEALTKFGRSDLGIMSPEEELSNAQLEYHWSPGVEGGRRLLHEFIDGGRLRHFDADRAKTDRNSTSRMSPHIHFGEISARTIYAAATAKQAEWGPAGEAAVADFLRQLGYREYSRYLSFHFPFTHERSLLEHLRAVPWRFDMSLFKAWRTGSTGYPLVDAGMREVWSTGWMHNRIRVVAASFLVKVLLLPWQWGLKHYWDALLDADLECDALGWQYCAGCLSDAHPLEYTVDLEAEAKKYDPKGNYVRRWLPVLARLPAQYIHSPWEAPPEVLADAGVELGVNYPWPVVDMEDSKSALASVVKIVEEAKETATVAGSGGAITGGRSGGPFRPPTRPDPTAAVRVWGPGSILVSSEEEVDRPNIRMRAGNAGNGVARVAVPSMKISDGASEVDEEVQSNVSGLGGNGLATGGAGDGSLVSGQGYSYAPHRSAGRVPTSQQRRNHQSAATDGRGSAAAPVPATRSTVLPPPPAAALPTRVAVVSAPPPRPPAPLVRAPVLHQPITAWAPPHSGAEAVLLEGLGAGIGLNLTPGSNNATPGNASGSGRRGASGGSNRASLTFAVVPTLSETPSEVRVPDTSAAPMEDDEEMRRSEEESGEQEEYGRHHRHRHRPSSQAVELYGEAEGTARDHPAPDRSGDGSDEEAAWPPENKRQRHNDTTSS